MNATDHQRERFEELFCLLRPSVRAYVRRRAPAESVDDIVSDTFLVLWRRIDEVPAEPLPWALTVARNVIGTEYRGRRRRQALWERAQAELAVLHQPGEAPEQASLADALARLSENDREALMLVAWDDLSPAQAAATLGIPASRFRVRLHRATRRLAAALSLESETARATSSPSATTSSKGALA